MWCLWFLRDKEPSPDAWKAGKIGIKRWSPSGLCLAVGSLESFNSLFPLLIKKGPWGNQIQSHPKK